MSKRITRSNRIGLEFLGGDYFTRGHGSWRLFEESRLARHLGRWLAFDQRSFLIPQHSSSLDFGE